MMKKNVLFFVLGTFMFSSVAVATIELGFPGGVSASTLLGYFKLSAANIATGLNRFQGVTQFELDVYTDNNSSVNNERRGINMTNTEAASVCLENADGSPKDYCMTSQGTLFKLEGSTGGAGSELYGTATAGVLGLQFDSISARTWISPAGVALVASTSASPPTPAMPSGFMVGSNVRSAATFLVDSTNDWVKHLPITAPAASECDDVTEKGRMFYDSAADVFKFCNGTAWEGFADGNTTTFTGLTDTPANYTSAAGKALKVNAAANAVEFVDVGTANVLNFKYEFDCGADSVDFFNDATIELSWDEGQKDLDIERVLTPTSGDVQAICEVRGGYSSSYYKETDLPNSNLTNIAPANGPGPGDWMDCVIAPEADTAYPSYEISFHNVGDSVPTATNCVVNIKKVL